MWKFCGMVILRKLYFSIKLPQQKEITVFYTVLTAWKVSKYGVCSGPYFSAFGLNTERYWVSLRIQSQCEKIQIRKNSVFGHLSRSCYLKLIKYIWHTNFSSQKFLESCKHLNVFQFRIIAAVPYILFNPFHVTGLFLDPSLKTS